MRMRTQDNFPLLFHNIGEALHRGREDYEDTSKGVFGGEGEDSGCWPPNQQCVRNESKVKQATQ